jgi:N-acetylglucosaminyldiphosphoundecaprenol N-acetyl-beta-D-mannosaminyltransferase
MNRSLLELPTRLVGPVPFRVARLPEAVSAILASRGTDGGLAVHFANAYTIALADSHVEYARVLSRGNAAVFSDGVPVTWVGRRSYPELAGEWERVYGPDVMTGVFERAGAPGDQRHYLLGGTPQTLDLLTARIAQRWPAVQIVGAESPPFRDLTQAEFAARDRRIRESGATLVWVGLGTPKQDLEVSRLAGQVPATCLAVGAAFDFIAGTKPQAPLWMQHSGTEWAFRLAAEPRRLSKRYLWGNPRFLWAVRKSPGLPLPGLAAMRPAAHGGKSSPYAGHSRRGGAHHDEAT